MNRRVSASLAVASSGTRSAARATTATERHMVQRRSLRPASVVMATTLDEVVAYLDEVSDEICSIYIVNNPFLSRIASREQSIAYGRFLEAAANVGQLETLSLQRSFITDEFIACLCDLWGRGRFPQLAQLNLSQNLISDDGFLVLGSCLATMTSPFPLKLWATDQLRPSSVSSDRAMLNALEVNDRLIHLEISWRCNDLKSQAEAILSQRTNASAADMQNLKTSLVELSSQTPHMKVFRLADNAALAKIWNDDDDFTKDGSEVANDFAKPDNDAMDDDEDLSKDDDCDLQPYGMEQVMSGMSLLAKNIYLTVIELPGNGLGAAFVQFFLNAIIDDGAFRSVRYLNLERNRFSISDVSAIVSLLDVHFAFEDEANPIALIPFESLRLAGQQDLVETDLIETNRESILARFISNQSLTDLTIDVGDDAMAELRLYLERNARKNRMRLDICCVGRQLSADDDLTPGHWPKSSSRRSSEKSTGSATTSPKARFLFSPKSPIEDDACGPADTFDDVMSMIIRESPMIQDLTLSNSGFLCSLHDVDARMASRGLINLLACNQHLHTISLTNCGIRDSFVEVLLQSRQSGNFTNLNVLDFTWNGISDDGIMKLIHSTLFDIPIIRLRHRITPCSTETGTAVLKLLADKVSGPIRIFEFDFDNKNLENQAELLIRQLAGY